MSGPARVLFLCTGNSCRSQMAEGWARALHGDRLEAHSAGTAPHGLDPRAVRVMAEAGIDIAGARAKPVDELLHLAFDLVVTVCDDARESCPVFPGRARVVHRGFDDPPALAREAATQEEALAPYRRVRDEIRRLVEDLPRLLAAGGTAGGTVGGARADEAVGTGADEAVGPGTDDRAADGPGPADSGPEAPGSGKETR